MLERLSNPKMLFYGTAYWIVPVPALKSKVTF